MDKLLLIGLIVGGAFLVAENSNNTGGRARTSPSINRPPSSLNEKNITGSGFIQGYSVERKPTKEYKGMEPDNEPDLTVRGPNGREFMVFAHTSASESVHLLHRVKDRFDKIVAFCEKEGILKLLVKRYPELSIRESNPPDGDPDRSSFVTEKTSMALCLRKGYNGEFHDIEHLFFAAAHELSHVAATSYAHDKEFDTIFEFIQQIARRVSAWCPPDVVDYVYCRGIPVTFKTPAAWSDKKFSDYVALCKASPNGNPPLESKGLLSKILGL